MERQGRENGFGMDLAKKNLRPFEEEMQIEIRNSVVSSNSEAFHFIAVLQLFYLTSSILECESGRKSASNSSSTLFLSQSRFYVYKICRKNFAKRFFFFWKRGERQGQEARRKELLMSVTNAAISSSCHPSFRDASVRSSELMASHFSAPR